MLRKPFRLKKLHANGFTLVELLITFVLVIGIGLIFFIVFKSSIFNFINLQTDASASLQLNTQSNRIAMVLRGTTGITSADNEDIVAYSYFYPSDAYMSLLHYYTTTTGSITQLKADVTPLTANPPTGTPITAQKRTYTIVDNLYRAPGVTLFQYLDSAGNTLSQPIDDLQRIKGIKVTVAAKASNNSNQSMTVQVSLRNRKTNL